MGLRLVKCCVWLLALGLCARAGPVKRDATSCATQCSGDSKFQYSTQTTYIYSYEASNTLESAHSSELSTSLKCSVEITRVSQCEMTLKIMEANVRHGGQPAETSTPYVESLKQYPMSFSWNDGRVTHVCPHPSDSEEAKNMKKAILSAFQNSMKSLSHDSLVRETDIIGTCDTEYKIKDFSGEKVTIHKTKNMASCSDHVKGSSGLLYETYESAGSAFQHPPLISDKSYACHQVIKNGITEEVFCSEKGAYQPLSKYSYGVKATGEVKLQLVSSKSGQAASIGPVKHKEKLVFVYEPRVQGSEEEATALLRSLCSKSKGLLANEVGVLIHKLVHTIRGLDVNAIEGIYDSLKSKRTCKSAKIKDIFIDSLKAASTAGAVEFLTKMVTSKELSYMETMLWMAAVPFVSHPHEGAVKAAAPLIRKNAGVQQAVLSVPSMAYKYCRKHPSCESKQAIKDVISNLQEYLGQSCKTSSPAEEDRVIEALKGFGNLGYVGGAVDSILKCVKESSNSVPLKIAAVEAFRRSPCSDSISSKVLDVFENSNENDEVRIAAAVVLSKCPSPPIIDRLAKAYAVEKSKQVEVFIWSYLTNLASSSDPVKRKAKFAAAQLSLKKPDSVDLTKFSRNIAISRFLDELNLGYEFQSNMVHSQDSYLPRSLNLDATIDVFGYQINLFEIGFRVENFDHELERLFGPRSFIPTKLFPKSNRKPEVVDSTADTYRSRIQGLKDKVNYQEKHPPKGSYYFRILGNEMRYRALDGERLRNLKNLDFGRMLNQLNDLKKLDAGHTFVFLDSSILLPSVTGRAYKLAANGSATAGFTSDMKIDVKNLKPGNIQFLLSKDGKSSGAIAVSATMSIHAEDYEPGVKVTTTMNAGIDSMVEIDVKKGPAIDLRFDFPTEKTQLFSMKRQFFIINENGEKAVAKPESHNLNYCTRYLQQIIGLKVCGQMSMPHLIDENGKPTIPFLGAMDASFELSKEDSSIKDYEIKFRMPESLDSDRMEFRIGFDTPNSSRNRKFLLELVLDSPSPDTRTSSFKFHTPFYTAEADASLVSRDDKLEMKIDVLGNKVRRYIINLDVEKDIKGARLAAYKPTLTVTLPHRDPKRFTGTVVFARGRKEQLSIDITSDSYGREFLIKGNIAKEGSFGMMDSEFEVISDLNINVADVKHRIQGSYKRVGLDVNMDMNVDYQPKGNPLNSVKLQSSLKNLNIQGPVSFSFEHQLLTSEYPNFNNKIKLDFSVQPAQHLKSNIKINYGRDFNNENRVIESGFSSTFDGDLMSFSRLNFDNKIQLKIPALNFDKAAFLSVIYDLTDRPKFHSEIGLKLDSDSYLKNELRFESFNKLNQRPIKLTVEAKLIVFRYQFLFRDEIQETSPNLLQGRAVLQPFTEKQIDIDYVYAIRSVDKVLYHEFESTIVVPGRLVPIQQKIEVKRSQNILAISSRTDPGSGKGPYTFDIKLNKDGPSELSMDLPLVKGELAFDRRADKTTFKVDFRTNDDRVIKGQGEFIPGDEAAMNLELGLGADGEADTKVVLNGKSSRGQDGRTITAKVNYADSINIDITGKISKHIVYGPHELVADFSGSMEPMTIAIKHEIANGEMNSYLKYLRSNTEKLRADFTGKFIHRYLHLEMEGRGLITSPYKAFDGKEVYLGFLLDSNEVSRVLSAEYRLKSGSVIGYVGKAEYRRKRGFPGLIKAQAFLTAHRRTVAEVSAGLEYGGGKYSLKTSIVPAPNRNLNFETSVEVASRYAAFRHNFQTTLQYLQLVSLNAVADLRNAEDLKMHSNFDINKYKVYDFNATLTSRSIIDFEGQVVLMGRLAPSLQLFTKTNNANSVTKFSLNLQKDSVDVITGRGEIKKRKKGFSGDIIFAHREKDFLTVTMTNEVKSQKSRNYVFKLKSVIRTYTISINHEKDKKTSKNTIALCRNEDENCINIESFRKESDGRHEYKLNYKRASIDWTFERMVSDGENYYHRAMSFGSGEKQFGYEVRYAFPEKNERHVYLGLRLPTRKVSVGTKVQFSVSQPRITFDVLADADRNPDRKLTVDLKADNQIRSDLPSKLQVTITHPMFEKPIQINTVAGYYGDKPKFFEGEVSVDYSSDPEDKIIAKMYAEKVSDTVCQVNMNVYHKDDSNLDFQFKTDTTMTEDKSEFGMKWIWSDDSNAEQNANLRALYSRKDRQFSFIYNRPKLDFRLDATQKEFGGLHDELIQMDIVMQYNGEVTKALLIHDSERNCKQLHIMGKDGEVSRKAEACMNFLSPVMVSIKTLSKEDDLWVFDYSYELARAKYGTLNIRHHWNPEFLGGLVFQYSQLADELVDAGFGRLPIASSPRYKIMSSSLKNKIIDPLKSFFSEESQKIRSEFFETVQFLKDQIHQYYESLPSFGYVRRFVRTFKPVFDVIIEGFTDYLRQVREELTRLARSLAELLMARMKARMEQMKAKCTSIEECELMMQAISQRDYTKALEAVKAFAKRLPEPIQKLLERVDELEMLIKRICDAAQPYIEPILKSKTMRDLRRYADQLRDQLKEHYVEGVKQVVQYAIQARQQFMRNERVKKLIAFFSREYHLVLNDIFEMDYGEMYRSIRTLIESYLVRFNLPTARNAFKINILDAERGVLDIDIFAPIDLSILSRIGDSGYYIMNRMRQIPQRYSLKSLLLKLKRLVDNNYVPPYREQALIVGQNHYVTFDKTFYDFAGECAYVLASDFDDGNFSIITTPTFSLTADRTGDRELSLGVLVKGVAVLVNLKDKTVKAGDNVVDLPYETKDLSVTRQGNSIVVDDYHGVQVKCHVVHDVCTASISGFYFGKTAGLFGTYNYEPADDFRRPKGQIPNSVTTFAKSYDLNKSCKTKNLAKDVKVEKSGSNYQLCKEFFEDSSSPLQACYDEVNPEEYLGLCIRHVATHGNKEKAMCNVAAAYLAECEKNYVELDLPSKCLTCDGPDGSKMKHGNRKEFKDHSPTSSDVVFVVESSSCNSQLLGDIDNLARAIDRELSNEGMSNNKYGVVVFHPEESPRVYTSKGDVLFGVGEVGGVARRINISSASVDSNALEALDLAVKYPFRSGTAKSIVLLSCSPCVYNYKSLLYPVIQQILLKHEIVLHVVSSQTIRLRKSSSKEKSIIGADADTVYSVKDITQKTLTGDPDIRSQVSLPKDACVALAQDVHGSFFSTQQLQKELKSWRSIFARRVVKTAKPSSCQRCDCTSTSDHVAQVMCEPCDIKKPRLPFSVCRSCNFPTPLTALYSYMLHSVL